MTLLDLLGYARTALALGAPAPAATDPVPSLRELLESVVKAYQAEYQGLQDTWRLLETKAQALASVAGIFIAATFAFARELPQGAPPSFKIALFAAVSLLLAATVAGVAVLFVRAITSPPGGADLERMVDDVAPFMQGAEGPERYRRLLYDQAGHWRAAVQSMQRAVRQKSRLLAAGQGLLMAAAALVSGIVMGMVWSR